MTAGSVTAGTDPNPPLQTARLRLEPQRADHAGVMLTVLSDPRVHTFLPSSPPTDVEALRERFARLESRRSPDGEEEWLNWVVFRRPDGPALGTVQATVRPHASEADVAYIFHPSAWGQGYAAEALRALLGFLAFGGEVREAVAQVDTRNRASIRLLTRLGFQQTGFTPHADEFRGEVSDEFTYRLKLAAGPDTAVPHGRFSGRVGGMAQLDNKALGVKSPTVKVLSVTVGDVTRELATVRVGSVGQVPLVEFLGDPALTNAAAQALVPLIPAGTDVLLTVVTNALPLAHELSDRAGLPYVVVRKKRRTYMQDPLIQDVPSMTLGVAETLWLDGPHAARLRGQRVTIVQDVIASGGTAQALARLVERAGGTVQGYLAAFKQGESRLPVIHLQELPTSL